MRDAVVRREGRLPYVLLRVRLGVYVLPRLRLWVSIYSFEVRLRHKNQCAFSSQTRTLNLTLRLTISLNLTLPLTLNLNLNQTLTLAHPEQTTLQPENNHTF